MPQYNLNFTMFNILENSIKGLISECLISQVCFHIFQAYFIDQIE